MFEGGPPESAGRPHEAAGDGSPRWMVAERASRGAREQNPAYRPAHPPPRPDPCRAGVPPEEVVLGVRVAGAVAPADPERKPARKVTKDPDCPVGPDVR